MPKIVKYIEPESNTVVARGWGRKEWGGTEFGDSCITLRMS